MRRSRRRSPSSILLILIAIIIAAAIAISQTIQFTLNIWEFGDLFIRPFYYSILGGLVLSIIAFFRIDFINRRSLTFWFLSFVTKFYRRAGYIGLGDLDFSSYKLSKNTFLA